MVRAALFVRLISEENFRILQIIVDYGRLRKITEDYTSPIILT